MFCPSYRITKLSLFLYLLNVRGFKDIISHPHFTTNQKDKYYRHFTGTDTEVNGAPTPQIPSTLTTHSASTTSESVVPNLCFLLPCPFAHCLSLSGAPFPLGSQTSLFLHLVLHFQGSFPRPLSTTTSFIVPVLHILASFEHRDCNGLF